MPMFLRKITHWLYLQLMKVAVNFAPSARHTAFVGGGSSAQLCEHIVHAGVQKLLVVTDKPLRELGVVDQALSAFAGTNVDIAYYDGVLPDPTYDQVAAGVAVARSHGSEAILALGGGSSIDAATPLPTSISCSTTSPVSMVAKGSSRQFPGRLLRLCWFMRVKALKAFL